MDFAIVTFLYVGLCMIGAVFLIEFGPDWF